MNEKKMEKRNKIILISGISVVSLVLLATIVSAFFTPEAPDPKLLGPKTKITYMASKQFGSLPEEEKRSYISKIGRSRRMYRNLSSTERSAVFKNTRKLIYKRIKEHTAKFFEMSEEEQNKFLDKRISQRDKWRAARKAREAKIKAEGADNNTDNNSGRSGNRSAWRQGFMEGMGSTTRAQMSEIRNRIRARSKQTQGK